LQLAELLPPVPLVSESIDRSSPLKGREVASSQDHEPATTETVSAADSKIQLPGQSVAQSEAPSSSPRFVNDQESFVGDNTSSTKTSKAGKEVLSHKDESLTLAQISPLPLAALATPIAKSDSVEPSQALPIASTSTFLVSKPAETEN